MADGGGLFGPIEARGLVPEAVGDLAFVRAMLRVESALARAQAAAGEIPSMHADAIVTACRGPAPDPSALGADAPATGAPVVPLLEAVRAALPPEVAASLHRGATTQDIVDTAAMLTSAGAVALVLADLEAVGDRLAWLAEQHATTPMAGRTLLQHARPTTFGSKAAAWLLGIDEGIDALIRVRHHGLALQLGGPVGTRDGLGAHPDAVVAAVSEELGLADPGLAWHAQRGRVVELAGAVGTAAASVAKVALDLVLLAQPEVGEVVDADLDRGGSSSMAYKRNPIAATLARAAAAQVPGLIATLVGLAGAGEHERAAGAWHAEWRALRALLVACGSAAAWLRAAVETLEMSGERMAANLALTGNLDDGRDAALAAAARHVERARTAHRSRAGERVQRASLVYHEVSGSNDGPTIVLGNSLGSTIEMWDGVVEELGTRYRIVRYDLRGHGRSPTPPGPYAIGELGADVIALLDELGVERANLVGSSIGGMAAMRVAAHAPERVDKLILIGTSAHLGPARSWIDRARTVLAAGTRAVSETVVGRWVTEDYAAGHPDAMARYGAMFDATDPTAYAGCCLAIAAMDQTWDLPRIGAPTLVIVGSDDRATPREHAEAIAERVPDARVATIEGTAHLPSLERPEEVVRLVKEHLA